MGFFSYTMIEAMVNQLNQLKDRIIKRNIKFINKDFKELDLLSENNLLILDPPYILRKDLY
jgi:site-specific DNA-adenine methylase